jgi:hypothetical protein
MTIIALASRLAHVTERSITVKQALRTRHIQVNLTAALLLSTREKGLQAVTYAAAMRT